MGTTSFRPFGDMSVFDGTGMDITATNNASGDFGNPYRFTGRRFDFEEGSDFTKLHFYRTRSYDSETGRFVSHDSIGDWGNAKSKGNGLVYCNNNPTNWVDPFGLQDAKTGRTLKANQSGKEQRKTIQELANTGLKALKSAKVPILKTTPRIWRPNLVCRKTNPIVDPGVFKTPIGDLFPANPSNTAGPTSHALGHVRGGTKFISASELPYGAVKFDGKRFWIDLDLLDPSETKVIRHSKLRQAIIDLAKSQPEKYGPRCEQWLRRQPIELEMLIEGPVRGRAIFTGQHLAAIRCSQGLLIIGVISSGYDVGKAGGKSYRQGSMKPIAAESIRQAGGWVAGWAGAQAGFLGGAACGVESGPGLILTGIVGGLIGGWLGYWGADKLADEVDEN